jgi:hypothetical protein
MEEEGVRQLETIMRTGHAALASSSNTKDSQLFPEQSHGTTLLFCFDFVFFFNMFNTARFVSRVGLGPIRWNSTAATSLPPMMATLRSDLKQAMRAKDQARYTQCFFHDTYYLFVNC